MSRKVIEHRILPYQYLRPVREMVMPESLLYPHGFELESCDPVIDIYRNPVNLVLKRLTFFRNVLYSKSLVCKAHVHDLWRVTKGTGKVHKPAFCKKVYPSSIFHDELLNVILYLVDLI